MKDWLVEVLLKKMGPSAVRAIIAGFVGLVVAHSGALEAVGIHYDKVAQTITLHLGALQDWIVASGLGLVTALLTAAQHHVGQAITPQGEQK